MLIEKIYEFHLKDFSHLFVKPFRFPIFELKEKEEKSHFVDQCRVLTCDHGKEIVEVFVFIISID